VITNCVPVKLTVAFRSGVVLSAVVVIEVLVLVLVPVLGGVVVEPNCEAMKMTANDATISRKPTLELLVLPFSVAPGFSNRSALAFA